MADVYSILVVDDNLLNLKLIEKVLTKEGYNTLLSDNGPDARRIAAQEHPDLILLDIEMPDETDLKLFGSLKMIRPPSPSPCFF
jgi:Response regulator containing CheY-like receiver, AAA-type ATPase, and DNA-binding domains